VLSLPVAPRNNPVLSPASNPHPCPPRSLPVLLRRSRLTLPVHNHPPFRLRNRVSSPLVNPRHSPPRNRRLHPRHSLLANRAVIPLDNQARTPRGNLVTFLRPNRLLSPAFSPRRSHLLSLPGNPRGSQRVSPPLNRPSNHKRTPPASPPSSRPVRPLRHPLRSRQHASFTPRRPPRNPQ
jgi:hypothetical protein